MENSSYKCGCDVHECMCISKSLKEELVQATEFRDRPIMLTVLPIMVCCSAHRICQNYAQE